MNFKTVPVLRQYTYPCYMGPGCERGKPFSEVDQHYQQPKKTVRALEHMDKVHLGSLVEHQRCKLNDAKNEAILYTYGDPPSHRSRTVSYNKDGMPMHSLSHYSKIGSKHLNQLTHSRSSPIHPMNERQRTTYFDHSKVPLNGSWTTSSQNIGSMWHYPKGDPVLNKQMPWLAFDWRPYV